MKLDIGSEKNFLDFINRLNDKDKIALVSHTDLDGLAAAKVVNKVVNADLVFFLNYEELAEPLVQKLKENKVTKVIFTDLYIGDKEFLQSLEEFAEVLILDHHLTKQDWNSERTTFIKGEDGYCAGYLCYYLFSKVQSIEQLDWLVACSCISDYCHIKTADWLTGVFLKYQDMFEQQGTYVRKNGPIWDLQESLSLAIIYFKDQVRGLNTVFDKIGIDYADIGDLTAYASKVKGEVERLVQSFEREKEVFPKGFLFVFEPRFPCGSMISTIVSGNYLTKIIITVRPDPHLDIYHISVRRQDKQEDMAAFLKNLVSGLEGADGGGHVPAAGGHFQKKDLVEIKRRLGIKV